MKSAKASAEQTRVEQRRAGARVLATLAIGALPMLLLAVLGVRRVFPVPQYLVAHVLVEFAIAFVAFATFAVQWYATRAADDARARFLGAAALAVAILEVCHVLVFPGMPGLLGPSSVERGIHYWLAGRLVTTGTLLASAFVPAVSRSPLLRRGPLAAAAAALALAYVAVEVSLPPDHGWLHADGRLTTLKVAIEASVAAIAALGALVHLHRHRSTGDPTLLRVAEALGWVVLAEACFSLYASAHDSFNLLGHVYAGVASWRIFDALFVGAILRPYARLDETSRELAASNARLEALRAHVEGELAATITRLEEESAAAGHARAELEAALAAVPAGILRYAADGAILAMNAGAEQLLRYDERVRRLPMAERWVTLRARTADGRPLDPEANPVARALRGEIVHGQPLVIEAGGKPRWVNMSAAPIREPDGSLAGGIAVIADVSDLQQLQSEREDLLRSVSHDLRNPLQIVLLQAERIQRLLPESAEKERRAAQTIGATARQMGAMIRDLVEAVRMDAGRLSLDRESIELSSWIPERLAMAAGVLDVSRVSYDFAPGLPPVSADASRLDRVVSNLIANALKYSPPTSPVEVSAAAGDGEVRIAVRDRGVGIAPEDLPHVFERFFRGSRTRRSDGLGLGLYIVRSLVEAHGGRIWVESQPDAGSTFWFTLPPAREAPRERRV